MVEVQEAMVMKVGKAPGLDSAAADGLKKGGAMDGEAAKCVFCVGPTE